MKIWKIVKITGSILVLCLVVFLSISCSSGSDTSTTTKTLAATVKTGNITTSITGTGNLAYSDSESLAFEIAGYVESVSVSAGDTVKKGQELATLNTTEWESQIKTLNKALTTAQKNLTAAQNAVTTAQKTIAAKEMAVSQAQLDLKTAQNAVTNISAIKTAQDAIDKGNSDLAFSKQMQQAAAAASGIDLNYWQTQITYLNDKLTADKKTLQDILDNTSAAITTDVALQIAKAQLGVTQAQKNLEDAQTAVEDAKAAVTTAQEGVTDAEQVVKDAQSDVDGAKSLSPTITAPFDGFITKVNVKGGDEVQKGTVAVQIADPTQFEANILITENDIFSVKVGGDATVSLDALSDLTFPAQITEVSPTATVSSGVVNYSVTVKLTSTQPATGNQMSTSTTKTSNASADASTTQTVTLKDGLSATVNIISQQADNVLIIPNKAITRQGQNSTVQVVNGTTTETRVVKTGITDSTNTEITSGLTAGETVTYKLSTSTSSSSSSTTNSNQQQGIPGIGGGGPPQGGF